MPRYPGGGAAHAVTGQIVEGAGVTRGNEAKAVVVQVQHDGVDGSNLRRLIRHYHQCAVNQRHIVILIAQLAGVARADDDFLIRDDGFVGDHRAGLLDLHVKSIVRSLCRIVINGRRSGIAAGVSEIGTCRIARQALALVGVSGGAILVVHQLHRAKLAIALVVWVAVKRNGNRSRAINVRHRDGAAAAAARPPCPFHPHFPPGQLGRCVAHLAKWRKVKLARCKADDAHAVSQRPGSAVPQVAQRLDLDSGVRWQLGKDVVEHRRQRIDLRALRVGGQHQVFPAGLPPGGRHRDRRLIVDCAYVYKGRRHWPLPCFVCEPVLKTGDPIEVGHGRERHGLPVRVINRRAIGADPSEAVKAHAIGALVVLDQLRDAHRNGRVLLPVQHLVNRRQRATCTGKRVRMAGPHCGTAAGPIVNHRRGIKLWPANLLSGHQQAVARL